MKVVNYIEWTEKGEYNKFKELIKTSETDQQLKQLIMDELHVDKTTANIAILRYRSKINSIRNNK